MQTKIPLPTNYKSILVTHRSFHLLVLFGFSPLWMLSSHVTVVIAAAVMVLVTGSEEVNQPPTLLIAFTIHPLSNFHFGTHVRHSFVALVGFYSLSHFGLRPLSRIRTVVVGLCLMQLGTLSAF